MLKNKRNEKGGANDVNAINKGRENCKKKKPLQNTITHENGPIEKKGLYKWIILMCPHQRMDDK
jgi:hypothetical protein